MTIGQRIRQRRKELGISAEHVAEHLNVDRGTIYRYERGAIDKVPAETLAKLAKVLYTSPLYLMGLTNEHEQEELKFDNVFQIGIKRFPLIGEVACGKPVYAEEDFESYVEAGTNIDADFCLRCKGDSMVNARILDGDIVFIKKQSMVNNGEIAAVVIGEEATLKRVEYFQNQNLLLLKAENPKYETLTYTNETLNQIQILGKAVAFQSDVR